MELHQLRYAVAVANSLSFTRAAAALSVAQPSLSQQIRKLEREVGFALFERSSARVLLTPEGELFLPYARAILNRLQEAVAAAEEIRGVERGRVTLGISPIAGARVLPVLLRAIGERYPGIEIAIREDGLGRLLDLLSGGDIDLAMVLLPATEPDLVCTTLLAEDLVLVLPAGYPLASRDAIELAEVRGEPFVLLTTEYGLRQRVVEECARAGFAPRVVFESREVAVIQGLVEAGLGLTIIPEGAVRRDLATEVRPVQVQGRVPQRQIGLAHRADRYVSRAARQVFALTRDLFSLDPAAQVVDLKGSTPRRGE